MAETASKSLENPADRMAKAREARRRRLDAGIKEILNPIEKSRANPQSLRLAINANCCSCQGGTAQSLPDAGWRWAIGNCGVTDCPLHPHRPYQEKAGELPEGVHRW